MQVTAIVIVIALIGMLIQFWLAVASILLILNLSFSQFPSYQPPNTAHPLNFDHLVVLSWEHVNHFFQLCSVLSSSMVGLVQLHFIFKTVGYLIEDFDVWRIV